LTLVGPFQPQRTGSLTVKAFLACRSSSRVRHASRRHAAFFPPERIRLDSLILFQNGGSRNRYDCFWARTRFFPPQIHNEIPLYLSDFFSLGPLFSGCLLFLLKLEDLRRDRPSLLSACHLGTRIPSRVSKNFPSGQQVQAVPGRGASPPTFHPLLHFPKPTALFFRPSP